MQLYVSSIQSFNPKLIVLSYDTPMSIFKQTVQERIFCKRGSTANSFSSDANENEFETQKIKVFTFTGMEICNDDELNMLELNAYLFVSQGEPFDGKACLGAFHKIRLLGEGGYGKVYLALNRMTKEEVAIKFLKVKDHNADTIHKLYKEADALRSLCHGNIVKLKFTFPLSEQRSIVIVMEYASGGELKGYLKKRGRLDEEEAKDIFFQLLDAVNYCHQKKIIHRDLKLNNIVFASPNSRDIRVIDFGIHGLYVGNSPEKSLAGSLKYMAPEILTGKRTAADPCFDIFSMGCILYALVTGELPFEGDQDIVRLNIINGEYNYPQDIEVTQDCKDLIDRMLENNPHKRIFMNQIYKHPWIEQYAIKFETRDFFDYHSSDSETFSIAKEKEEITLDKEDQPIYSSYLSQQNSQDDINYEQTNVKFELGNLNNDSQFPLNFEIDNYDGQQPLLDQKTLDISNQRLIKNKFGSEVITQEYVPIISHQKNNSQTQIRNLSMVYDQNLEASPLQDQESNKITQNGFELKKRKQKSIQRNTIGQFIPFQTHERRFSNLTSGQYGNFQTTTNQPFMVVNNFNINNYNHLDLSKKESNQTSEQSLKFPDINMNQQQRNLRTKKQYESSYKSNGYNSQAHTDGLLTQALSQPNQFDEKSHDRLRKYIKEKIKESHDLIRPIGLTKMQKQQLNIFNKYLKELELKYDDQNRDSPLGITKEETKKDNCITIENTSSPKAYNSLSPIKAKPKNAINNNNNSSRSNIQKKSSIAKRIISKKRQSKLGMVQDDDFQYKESLEIDESNKQFQKKKLATQEININKVNPKFESSQNRDQRSMKNLQVNRHKRSNSSFSQIPELQEQPSTSDIQSRLLHLSTLEKKQQQQSGSFRKVNAQEEKAYKFEKGLTRYDSPTVSLRNKFKIQEIESKQAQSLYATPKYKKDISQRQGKAQFGLIQAFNEKFTNSSRVLIVANEQRSEKLDRQRQLQLGNRKSSESPPLQEPGSGKRNWMYNSSTGNSNGDLISKLTSTVFGKKFMIESILTKCDNDTSPVTVKHHQNRFNGNSHDNRDLKGFTLKQLEFDVSNNDQ